MTPIDESWLTLRGHEHGWLAMAAFEPASEEVTLRFRALYCEGERKLRLFMVQEFCAALEELHKTLEGEVQLATYEHDFELTFRPIDAFGHIRVEAKLDAFEFNSAGDVGCGVEFNFQTDQSHLPAFARGLRQLHRISQ